MALYWLEGPDCGLECPWCSFDTSERPISTRQHATSEKQCVNQGAGRDENGADFRSGSSERLMCSLLSSHALPVCSCSSSRRNSASCLRCAVSSTTDAKVWNSTTLRRCETLNVNTAPRIRVVHRAVGDSRRLYRTAKSEHVAVGREHWPSHQIRRAPAPSPRCAAL